MAMDNSLLFLLILTFSVNVCLSEEESNTEVRPGVYYIEELDEHNDVYSRLALFSGKKRKKLPLSEELCFDAHMKCIAALTSGHLVCAQHNKYGLINFPSTCEIRFQNCLIKARESDTGIKSKTGPFYFNGQDKGCHYYVKRTNTIEDAVKLYFLEDVDYKIDRDEDYIEEYGKNNL